MTRFVIRFRRPLKPIDSKRQSLFFLVIGWKPVESRFDQGVKPHYWNSKDRWWTVAEAAAYRYSTKERAEKAAFKLVVRDPTLVGELEVVEASDPPLVSGTRINL